MYCIATIVASTKQKVQSQLARGKGKLMHILLKLNRQKREEWWGGWHFTKHFCQDLLPWDNNFSKKNHKSTIHCLLTVFVYQVLCVKPDSHGQVRGDPQLYLWLVYSVGIAIIYSYRVQVIEKKTN